MNIVLIGYRGTGKSAVGRILVENLGLECVSMDSRIVEKIGMSIADFVKVNGWPKFRDVETEVARELSGRDGLVIDCGGGVIERPENIEMLKKNGKIFWLKASVQTIVRRIEGDTARPSLTGKSFTDEVAEVLERRTPLYRAAAQAEIDTDSISPEAVAEEICKSIT